VWKGLHLSPFWKNALKYGLGFGLLGYVIATRWESKPNPDMPGSVTPGLREVFNNPVQWDYFALAAVFCAGGVLITFVRWYTLVRAQELPFTLYEALRLGLVGYYLSTFLPGSIGGDLVKAYAISREQSRRTVAVSTVLIDRGVGLWGLIWMIAGTGTVLTLIGSPLILDNPVLQRLVRIAVWLIVASVTVWVLLGFLPQRRADRFAQRLAWVPKIGHSMAEFWRAIWAYRKRPVAILLALMLSVISHSCFVMTFHLATRVFTATYDPESLASISEHMLIVPAGLTGQAFIPTPGGVGGAEALFGYLYRSVLLKPDQVGVLGCLAKRIIEWGLGFIGYLVYLRMKTKLPIVTSEVIPESVTPSSEVST